MVDFTVEHFEELCAERPVQEQILGIEDNRKGALRQFWTRLAVTMVGSIGLAVLLWNVNEMAAMIAMVLGLVGGAIWAYSPLEDARKALKLPVLEALAARGGMTYAPDNFEPPVFGEARGVIFGSWITGAHFTDLFYGQDPAGSNFAFYEATLTRKVGKNTQQIFSGQCYALERKGTARGLTVILPDKGIFNFFKPASGMERVRFEDHPEFEKRFEVYSTEPLEAKMLLASRVVRDQLLEARGDGWGGRLFAYLSPTDAFIAIQGKNRFEPGSMFRSRPGQERVRLMFDEVCGSLTVMNRLKAAFG